MQPWDEVEYAALLSTTRTAFSARLNPLTDEELGDAAKMAEGLMADPGWTVLSDLLAWRRSQALRLISHGRILDQAEYIAATSLVSGIDQARFVLDALVQLAGERREQAEQMLAEEESRV